MSGKPVPPIVWREFGNYLADKGLAGRRSGSEIREAKWPALAEAGENPDILVDCESNE